MYFAPTSGAFTYFILTKALLKSRLSLVDDIFWYKVTAAIIIFLMAYAVCSRNYIKLILQ